MTLKFLADMGLAASVVQWLRDQGCDAVHLTEQGLQRLPDSAILDKAEQEERVVLTVDLDFGTLLAARKASAPSVILFRVSDERPASIKAKLSILLANYEQTLGQGAIIVVTDKAIRVRSLPI